MLDLSECGAMEMSPVIEGRRIEVRGTVQGVGFRPWIYRLAIEEGLSGRVRNDARGVDRGIRRPEASRPLRRLGKRPPRASSRECAEKIGEPSRFAIVLSREGLRRV
jgi:hydrogenase maturation protein HypF